MTSDKLSVKSHKYGLEQQTVNSTSDELININIESPDSSYRIERNKYNEERIYLGVGGSSTTHQTFEYEADKNRTIVKLIIVSDDEARTITSVKYWVPGEVTE